MKWLLSARRGSSRVNPAHKINVFWAFMLCMTAVFLSACGQIEVSEAETVLVTQTTRPSSVLAPAPTKVSPTRETPATDPVAEPTRTPATTTTNDAPFQATNTPLTEEIPPATAGSPSRRP